MSSLHINTLRALHDILNVLLARAESKLSAFAILYLHLIAGQGVILTTLLDNYSTFATYNVWIR